MKVQSIVKIAEVLKKNMEVEDAAFKNIRGQLDVKYGVGWKNEQLTEEEFVTLRQQMKVRTEAEELYREFAEYNF